MACPAKGEENPALPDANQKDKSPRNRGQNIDIFQALTTQLLGLDPKLQETLVQAGFKPPKEEVQDPLLLALKENEDQLPDAVKQVMAASQEGIKNPFQEERQSSNELPKAAQGYKILVKKIMDLQEGAQGAKEVLRHPVERF